MDVAERELLEQTLHGAIKALTEVLSLASPAAFGRSSRLKELTGALARATDSGDAWEIEVASMLVQPRRASRCRRPPPRSSTAAPR